MSQRIMNRLHATETNVLSVRRELMAIEEDILQSDPLTSEKIDLMVKLRRLSGVLYASAHDLDVVQHDLNVIRTV